MASQARPSPVVLVSLGHSRCFEETWPLCLHLVIGEDIASVGFGKTAHVSFDGDESAFRAQSRRLFWVRSVLGFSPSPFFLAAACPGQGVSMCVLLRDLSDGC